MPWIGKVESSFNKYIGENGEVVTSIAEAKEFKTKKEATAFVKDNGPRTPIVIVKIEKVK